MKTRVETLVMALVLLGVGFLLGSFFLGWRTPRLEVPGSPASYPGVPSSASEGTLDERVSVEVLNGAGEAGAAARVTEVLRGMGFDVKTFGNAASFDHELTQVLDRSGRRGAARSVADSLGLANVVPELRRDLYLDATVVLGRDWRERIGGRE